MGPDALSRWSAVRLHASLCLAKRFLHLICGSELTVGRGLDRPCG